MNRLYKSKSPYLLSHAQNPVNWYPWSAEAFEKARLEDKPIFLSIGYSACHWCHEMAKESFSDKKTADVINKFFVPIKVDREQRPDIDTVYMNVCRAITGSGGWPLNLFLTPSKKPFFAGTYYPEVERGGLPSFKSIAESAARAWSENRQEIVETAGKIAELINDSDFLYSEDIFPDSAETAFESLQNVFDEEYGGFGSFQKFPMAPTLLFLLLYSKKYASREALDMAEKTLSKIATGGLCDHIGGGFFRYSTTRNWSVPHYEKMLFENALLAYTFFEAGEAFEKTACRTLEFMLDSLRSQVGGFYTSLSAVTKNGEGAFYLWNKREIKEVLGKAAPDFCKTFNIGDKKSLPQILNDTDKNFSAEFLLLKNRRAEREKPSIDKKFLTSANCAAICAFARGYRATQNKKYLISAKSTLNFLDENLRSSEGRLMSSFCDGELSVTAFADDYCFYLWALLELYDATEDSLYLKRAQEAWLEIMNYFWDERGGVYFYAADAEGLILRPMEAEDGALPSSNSVLALCLEKLYSITGDTNYLFDAKKIYHTFGSLINEEPAGFCFMLYANMLRS